MGMKVVVNYAFSHLIASNPKCSNDLGDHKKFDTVKSENKAKYFEMPLQYPRYTKEDYAKMEEWRVDMLLRQYGLDCHVKGSLDDKRRFAMGAFLWPDQL